MITADAKPDSETNILHEYIRMACLSNLGDLRSFAQFVNEDALLLMHEYPSNSSEAMSGRLRDVMGCATTRSP
jgi:hypothetical protein